MIFYLGTHIANWLGKMNIPLFISRRIIYKRKTFPRAQGRWALDSGGFSELSMFGKWETSSKQYAKEVNLFSQEIGNMDFAAVQDWMCEPFIVQKTGLSVFEHQIRSIQSYEELKSVSPEIPWMPVLQGFEKHEYINHVEMYLKRGIDLRFVPIVGVGSICRRQHTKEAEDIVKTLSNVGIKIHGLGLKKTGLRKVFNFISSADSMAWSFAGRRSPPLPGHTTHKNCANCVEFAVQWREKLLNYIVEQGV